MQVERDPSLAELRVHQREDVGAGAHGQEGVALYLHRRHGLPLWEITGTIVFLSFVEIYQLGLYSFVGAAAGGELGGVARLPVYAALAGYLLLHLWYFS